MPPRSNQPTAGARDPDLSDRAGNAGPGTDLPASTPVEGEPNSGATPPAQVTPVEPLSPEFANKGPDDDDLNSPGLGGEDEQRVKVETTGEFMIQDPYTLDVVAASGTSDVRKTSFIETAINDGRLKLA